MQGRTRVIPMIDELAIRGGRPVRDTILPFVPESADIGEEEVEAALGVLRTKRLSQLVGEEVSKFEEDFSKYYGVKHAIAVTSGTTALHLALAAAQLGPGGDVVLPPYTFMATANAILHQGLVPVFADVNPQTYNLDPDEVDRRVTEKTKAIIPVHMLGQPADMRFVLEVARRHGLMVIEDCAQANGAEYQGRKVGTFGDIGCFSFYLNKHITTGGEGGMLITNDDELAERARSIANHCRVRVSPYPNVPAHNVYWGVGYNYRMTEIQAAIGRVQLRRLESFVEKRRKNAEYLTRRIREIPGLEPPYVASGARHVYWAYGALVVPEKLGASRDSFARALLAEGVKAEGYCPIPVHLQEVVRDKVGYGKTSFPFDNPLYGRVVSYHPGLCPRAEQLSQRDLLLPVYQTLTDRDLDDVTAALEKVARNATSL